MRFLSLLLSAYDTYTTLNRDIFFAFSVVCHKNRKTKDFFILVRYFSMPHNFMLIPRKTWRTKYFSSTFIDWYSLNSKIVKKWHKHFEKILNKWQFCN